MQQLHLSIPEPCHQNWQEMTPTQQGRFCNACAKEVIDFSTMSDNEVLNYFSSLKNEKVCGRAYPDQLERTITIPKEIKKRKFWYWNYAAMFFLFFSKMSIKAQAQGMIAVVKNTHEPKKIKTESVLSAAMKKNISGKITNKDDNPVSFASVKIAGTNTGVMADIKGEFSIVITNENVLLEVSAAGFKTIEIFPATISPIHNIILEKAANTTLDTLMVVSYGTIKGKIMMMGAVTSVQKENKSFMDTIKSLLPESISFKSAAVNIYPNPVQRGNSFTLSLKLKQTGNYNIQIVNAAGQIVLQKQTNATFKEYIEHMQTDSRWSGGVYFIRVFDATNKLINTNNFIIQ